MSDLRAFKKLIRLMRRSSDVAVRLVGCAFVSRRGHQYRLVPVGAFDEALELLRRFGGDTQAPSVDQEKKT